MSIKRETRQKEILNEEINKINKIFTADEILEKLKTKDKKISQATVYRFLKELRKQHQVHSYICNKKTIYSKNKLSHCHFNCKKCKSIKHINLDSIDFIKNQLEEDICHIQIEVSGLCKSCSRN